VAEVRNLVERGVSEITLLGQTVNAYGRHDTRRGVAEAAGTIPFGGLLTQLDAIEGLRRIRYTSPHPLFFDEVLLRAHGELESLCPHVHMPVQSGSDRVLEQMRRRYTRADYETIIKGLRAVRPDIVVTTDLIVGFPGEGDREWQESMEFVESCGFSHIHIFPYSSRQGTKAATFAEQVSPAAKKLRIQQLNLLAKRMRMEKMNHFRGSHFQVLVENCSETVIDGKLDYFGYTPNYLKVKIPSLDDPSLINNIRTVALTNYDEQSTLMNARFIDTIEAVNI